MKTLAEKAAALAARIEREVTKSAGKGLEKAVIFLGARVKETASVSAPTKTVTSRDGTKRKVATTKATPGAPLRVVTGRFRNSIFAKMIDETTGVVGSNVQADVDESAKAFQRIFGLKAEGFRYANYHEVPGWHGYSGAGKHQTFTPTIKKYLKEIGTIVGSDVKIALEKT